MNKKSQMTSALLLVCGFAINNEGQAVQRFVMDEESTLGFTTHNQKTTLEVASLEWEGRRLDPIKSLDIPNHYEWIIASGDDHGPSVQRGQRVTVKCLQTYTNSQWDTWSEKKQRCCCISAIVLAPLYCIAPILLCCSRVRQTTSDYATSIGQINFDTKTQPDVINLYFNI